MTLSLKQTHQTTGETSAASQLLGPLQSQLGFHINKGVLHIKQCMECSVIKGFVHFVVISDGFTTTATKKKIHLGALCRVAALEEKGRHRFTLSVSPTASWNGEGSFQRTWSRSHRALNGVSPSSSSVSDGRDREDTCPQPRR